MVAESSSSTSAVRARFLVVVVVVVVMVWEGVVMGAAVGGGGASKILRGWRVRFPVVWAGWGPFMSIRRSFGMVRGRLEMEGAVVVVGLAALAA